MEFLLNHQPVNYNGDPDVPLLRYLRDHCGIVSAKDGCAPQAACGSCTVQLNEKAVLACVIPMKKVAAGRVTTIEGLCEYRQRVFANAFVNAGGVQCGFCIPGVVMQANALVGRNADPSRAEIAKALTPNLCRCTGYTKIVDAVHSAAKAIREETEITAKETPGHIGMAHPKYAAADLVLGKHEYTDDIHVDGLLHGALKFSDHPRARVLQIDTSAARALPGVLRVLTAEDVPGERMLGLIRKDWPLMIAEGETTRYIGDVLAGVIAEREKTARTAVDLIEVDYEVLPAVTNPHQAMQAGCAVVHPGSDGNVLSVSRTGRGNMAAAEKDSTFISRGTFQTQRIEHGFMEPECAVAYPSDDGMEVLSQGQGVYEDRSQIAALLALPETRVRVILVPNGGGFGGKEDLSVQGHAALMAHALHAPVKVGLNRVESINMHPKRHPVWMDYSVGCDSMGKLTFVKAQFVGDTGAYASVGMKVMERCAGHATGAYHVPVVDVESTAVYTNNIPSGAMRGFGVNQATFGLESCIDDLCDQGGFDCWQFRYDNALTEGRMTATGQVIEGGAGVRETLRAVRDEYTRNDCVGLACGIKNTGIGNGMPEMSRVRVTIAAPDRVIIDHGWTEMGQGVNTMALQALCHETGIEPGVVEVRVDTVTEQYAGMTTASRATSLMCNAIIDAARTLKRDLASHPLSGLVGREYQGEWKVDWTSEPGDQNESTVTHYSYSYATQLVVLDESGQLKKVVAAHDAGKVFNPTLFEGQLEGAVHMGLGYAISEDLPMENGRPKSTRLRKCGILRAKEMPEIEVIGVEVPDPHGPYGAKGVGEIGLVPTAAAVANALFQFDGVRRTALPMHIPKRRLQPVRAMDAEF
ncbi:MAG TPA: selenium-dependent xanthine dehydrogenase [Anaerolineales bacterium]|jgi:xanthine dehydrogenase molybdenum-binding subunit|nr:selenium-dependent xanthine dehydrogenase [Anaerolineales bacterium]